MPPSMTARNRPEAQHAWRGPSMLIMDNEGRSGNREFQGYFFRETRFLHDLRLEVQGESPYLSGNARVAPNELAFTYVHPPVPLKGVGSGTGGKKEIEGILTRDLDLYLRYRLHPGSVEAVLEITNRGASEISRSPASTTLSPGGRPPRRTGSGSRAGSASADCP
jgi:hypothetical protein